ncbi:unnamed protein product, partial [Brenthis ino]
MWGVVGGDWRGRGTHCLPVGERTRRSGAPEETLRTGLTEPSTPEGGLLVHNKKILFIVSATRLTPKHLILGRDFTTPQL